MNEDLPLQPISEAFIARAKALSVGRTEWRVFDPADGAYCMSFTFDDCSNPEREAREWLAERKRSYPDHFGHYEVGSFSQPTECQAMLAAVIPVLEGLLRDRGNDPAASGASNGASNGGASE